MQDFRIVLKYCPVEQAGNFVGSKQKLFSNYRAAVGRSTKSIRSKPVKRLFENVQNCICTRYLDVSEYTYLVTVLVLMRGI